MAFRRRGAALIAGALACVVGGCSASGRPLPEVVPQEFREVVKDDGGRWEAEASTPAIHGLVVRPAGSDRTAVDPHLAGCRGETAVEGDVVRLRVPIELADTGSPVVEAHAALFPVLADPGEAPGDAADRALEGPPVARTTARPADGVVTPTFDVSVDAAPWRDGFATWLVSVLVRAESGALERLVVEVTAARP